MMASTAASPLRVILSGNVTTATLPDEMKIDLFEAALEFVEALELNHLALRSSFTRIIKTFRILKKERNLKISIVAWLKNLYEAYLDKLQTLVIADVDHLINYIEINSVEDHYSLMARGSLFLSDFAGIVKDMAELGSIGYPCLTHDCAIIKGIKYTGSGHCSSIDDLLVVATTSVKDLRIHCEQAATHCGDEAQGGYDCELFVNDGVKKIAYCSICMLVFRRPKRCPCDHLFCLSCVEKLLNSCKKDNVKAACPMCRINLPELASLAADNFAQNYVDSELVRCYNSCVWKGQLQELNRHVCGRHCANRLTNWCRVNVWVDSEKNRKEKKVVEVEMGVDEIEVHLIPKQFATHLLSFFRMRLQHDPLVDGLAFAQSIMWPLEKNGSTHFGRKAKRMFVAVNDFHCSGLTINHSLGKDGREVYNLSNTYDNAFDFRSIHLNDPDETKSDKYDTVFKPKSDTVYEPFNTGERLYARHLKRIYISLLVCSIIVMYCYFKRFVETR